MWSLLTPNLVFANHASGDIQQAQDENGSLGESSGGGPMGGVKYAKTAAPADGANFKALKRYYMLWDGKMREERFRIDSQFNALMDERTKGFEEATKQFNDARQELIDGWSKSKSGKSPGGHPWHSDKALKEAHESLLRKDQFKLYNQMDAVFDGALSKAVEGKTAEEKDAFRNAINGLRSAASQEDYKRKLENVFSKMDAVGLPPTILFGYTSPLLTMGTNLSEWQGTFYGVYDRYGVAGTKLENGL